MKLVYLNFTFLILIFWFGACNQEVVENPVEEAFSFDLSNLKLDFSSLEIDFELLFEYDDNESLLEEAEKMIPFLWKDAKDIINEGEEISHVIVSFQIGNGKVKLKEILMFNQNVKKVNDYHNYTKKLGARDGLSASEELMKTAFDAEPPKNYVEIDYFEFTGNERGPADTLINYIENNYQSESDMLDIMVMAGLTEFKAYGKRN